jgi:type IV secretory pathway VirB4 component
MEDGFVTGLPLNSDRLNVNRNMDTTSLATTFPFVSSDLSDDKGIMYGINMHNGSLVIFDRFSMPNYNSVVFATAGAGKSYMIKLEVLRSLMMGSEIIVIDPENEYRDLAAAVGGQYIAFGYGEEFEGEAPADLLGQTMPAGEGAVGAGSSRACE